MNQSQSKWSWARMTERIANAIPTRKQDNIGQPQEDEENPWVVLSERRTTSSYESKISAAGGQEPASGLPRTPARWLSDNSPYGFSDDDGTLKQVDGSNWRHMFGTKSSSSKRFVASPSRKRPGTASPGLSTVSKSGPAKKTTVERMGSTFALQTVAAAVLLVAGVYVHHQSGTPWTDKMNALYQSAFTKDYSGVILPAVSQFASDHHISIPAFGGGNTGAIVLHAPLSGTITADYSTSHPEMFIEGLSNQSVLSAGSGTVEMVTKVSGGYMVRINHGTIGVSQYVGLGDVSVKQGEAVSAGQIIGHLPKTTHPELRFSILQDGKFINPHDDIHFPDAGV